MFLYLGLLAVFLFAPAGVHASYIFAPGVSVSTCSAGGTAGIGFTDTESCRWCATTTSPGSVMTTLVSCPAVTVVRACTAGMSLGILLAITCG